MPRFLQTFLAKRQDAPKPEPVVPQPVVPHGAPLSLILETGTYPVMRGVRYTISGGIVTRVRHGNDKAVHSWKPASGEWEAFWSTVESLGVRHWRKNYQKPRRPGFHTFDGKGWHFELRSVAFNVQSCGIGACPALAAPHESTTSFDAIHALQTELDRLIDG